jgi:hypothetical protein
MPWSSTTFTLLYDWVARRDAGSPTNIIGATEMQAQEQDLADGLEACVKANGDIAATANLPMGGFLHTNVGAATARTNYLRVTEYQDGGHVWIAGGGTADAITATYAPALTALTNGCRVRFRATAANATTTPTFAPNGLTAKTIVKGSNSALVAGDIAGASHECTVQYNSTTDKWHLVNPAYGVSNAALDLNALTTDATGGAVGDLIPFVDVSDANASNKVTFQNLLDNALANFTADATGGATGDKLLFADVSEAGSPAQTVTVDNLVVNSLQLLTTDSTGGATGDFIPFVDVSDSNAGNKVTTADFVYNFLNNGTAETAIEPNADHVLVRDNSAGAYRKVLTRYLKTQESIIVAVSDESTAITTGTAKVTFRMPYAFTLTDVRASLSTASSSGVPAFDINEAGASIFSTTLTIDANEKTSTTAAVAAALSDTSLADDAEMTIDIDTAGTGAKGAKIYLIGYRT